MECSVYIGQPAILEHAFRSFDDNVGMTLDSEDLIACSVEAQRDLLEAFGAVRPQDSCSWAPAFAEVFSVLFWSSADGTRHREASWAITCEPVDCYFSPETVTRLAQQAATIYLDDLNRAFLDYSAEGWIQDFNDFRAMAAEWLDILARASEGQHALAIAVWD